MDLKIRQPDFKAGRAIFLIWMPDL